MGIKWKYILKTIFSRRENRVFIPIIIIIFMLLFYSLSSIFLSPPSRPQLSAYSDTWRDVSNFRSALLKNDYEVSSIISTPTILSKFNKDDYKYMVYIAIGVERPYSKDDSTALWTFMRYGGNIIIADDFGYGNTFWDASIASGYGKVEFENKQMFDPNYIKNTTFVSINATLPGPSMQYSLLLNEPSVLKKSYGASHFTTLGSSSDGSWLDENGNRVRDPLEPKTAHPVIILFKSSSINGKAFFISDPGLFINENWGFLDNARFTMDLIHYLLPNGGKVIFDESRHIFDNSFENARRTVYSGAVYLTSSVWRIVLAVVIVISFTLLVGVKLKPQKIWKNQNMLNVKYFNILNHPQISIYDNWQLCTTFLEKVRHSYGFSAEEFSLLDEGTMNNLIANDYIWDFINQRQNRYFDAEYYSYLVNLMVNWQPKTPQVDDLVYNSGFRDNQHNGDSTQRDHQTVLGRSEVNQVNQDLSGYINNPPADDYIERRGD